MDESGVRERIIQTKSVFDWTENSIAGGDSATQKRLNRQISHGGTLTLDTILLFLDKFPSISSEWLLRGSGEMLLDENAMPVQRAGDFAAPITDVHHNNVVFVGNWDGLAPVVEKAIEKAMSKTI